MSQFFLKGPVAGSRAATAVSKLKLSLCSNRFLHTRLAADLSHSRLAAGDKLHGYTVQSVIPVSEFSLTAISLEHCKTGAQHLHIDRRDHNNVFGVAFRTTPRDSTGVPHILEHLSLCGSTRYPVRDPFFKMLTRSLSTFMNAFTANDWTMYPFSTQNLKDFNNLMSVYLDAAFFPRLLEQDFRQEGWRLEHENVQDPNSPIVFKGVVFNEMKGAFSSAEQLFATKNQNLLMPSNTYGVVSGGDPAHIPDLTWKQLKDFHKHHYHPSNSRFYTYGDFPLEQHLERINALCLSQFNREQVFDTAVAEEQRWTAPKEALIHCAPDPMSPDPNKNTTIAVSYLLTSITDVDESCSLSILGGLLTDGEKSPFYQSLIESGIGSDFAPTVGYNGYTREASFSIGLQRVDAKDVDKVKSIINETFDRVIKNGFEPERIEAILHKIELSLKHQSEKFGLHLGISVLPGWTHDGDPVRLMEVNKQVSEFKRRLADNPRYLQDLVQKYFKNNHRLTLVMSPQDDFNAKREAIEKSKLSAIISTLNDKDKKDIYDKGLELSRNQSQTQDLSCLPTLQVSDIDRLAPSVETKHIVTHGVPVQLCVQPTNGITYFRAISSVATLPSHLKSYIPLFCNVVTKMGAGELNYQDLSERIELKTGGLHVQPHLCEYHKDSQLFEQGLLFSSHCLDHNLQAMFQLWTRIFTSLELADTNRLRTLLMMAAADMSAGLSDSGHNYAMKHSASTLSPCSALKELMSGMTQVELMKKLAESPDATDILQHLKEIATNVLNANNMRCSLNMTPETADDATKATEEFLSSLPSSQSSSNTSDVAKRYTKNDSFVRSPGRVHFDLPFQVHYVGKSVTTVSYSHPDHASLQIAAKILSTRYLHREIREKGGAYGGGAVSSAGGLFHFYSYRDPSLNKTLDAFENSVRWVASGDFTQQDINESMLSVFSQVDSPVPPGSKGSRLFVSGIDDETFQKHREQLLAVTKDDIIRVNNEYLTNAKIDSVTVLGPASESFPTPDTWTIKK